MRENLLNTLSAWRSCIGVLSLLSICKDSCNPTIINNRVISDIADATNHTQTYHRCCTARHPIAGQIIIETPKTAPIKPNAFALFFPCVISERYAIATPLFHHVIPSIILENKITRRGSIIPQIGIFGKKRAHTNVSKLSNVPN